MSFHPYPQYKDSGIEWLGEVPEHWGLVRFKQLFREASAKSEHGEEVLLSVSEYYGVKPRSETIDQGEFLSRAESLVGYKICQKNDLVMNIMLAWKRGLGVTSYSGIVSPAYAVFQFIDQRTVYPAYYHYLLRTDTYTGYFKSFSSGVIDSRLRLYPESFFALTAIVPNLNEQTQIARFLDHETGKIDGLIAEQEKLIELLKEKRQATISHAVTKGLNPDAPMKDSGVEWLGEVPEHWAVAPLKYRLNLITDKSNGHANTVALENIEGWSGKFLETKSEFIGNGVAFAAGDILFGKLRPYLAKVYLAKKGGAAVGDFHVLRPAQGVLGRYAQYQVLSRETIDVIDSSTYGAKMPRASWEFMGGVGFVLPPEGEQEQIVEHLDCKTAKFDILLSEAQRGIELLKERRSALISAAVTGKIDVRNWKP